jgi:hypothetical protein
MDIDAVSQLFEKHLLGWRLGVPALGANLGHGFETRRAVNNDGDMDSPSAGGDKRCKGHGVSLSSIMPVSVALSSVLFRDFAPVQVLT